jgi:hypothetical protein
MMNWTARLYDSPRYLFGGFMPFVLVAACEEQGVQSGDLADAGVTAADEVVLIGTSETIGHIVDVAEGDDGTVWILNDTEPWFLAMSPDGEVSRSWGRRGGGPNEFRNPTTLMRDAASGHIFAYDAGHHALMRVDGPEDPVETIRMPRDSIPTGRITSAENLGAGGRSWIEPTQNGYLVGVRLGDSDLTGMWGARIVELSRDASVRPAFAIADRLGDPASRYGGAATEFLPFPLYARCPDGSVALYNPLDNAIVRLSPGDEVIDTIPLPPERNLEVTFDRVFRMAYGFFRAQAPGGQTPDSATMYAMLQNEWAQVENEAAGVFPEYADLHCPDGSLWIQLFDPDHGQMGRGPVWTRVAANGTTSAFRFPDSFRPLRFREDRVLGISVGEFDIESVAAVPLPGETRQ